MLGAADMPIGCALTFSGKDVDGRDKPGHDAADVR
jgi:hypothetical protein